MGLATNYTNSTNWNNSSDCKDSVFISDYFLTASLVGFAGNQFIVGISTSSL